MELAAGALGSLLPKLSTLLTGEYKLQKGVRGEIRFLQAEMESMQAALDRVSKLPGHQIDDLNKIWVRDLKELVYDIEDSVDAFMVHVDALVHAKPHSFRRFFDRTIGLLTKAMSRHHIADDIQDIKRRIQLVADRRGKYKFEDIMVQPDNTAIDPRLPALYQDVKNLVGIDGPAKKIYGLLMHGEGVQKQQLMVLSIVGVGGLGKTTLANSVYQRLRREFQSRAFVSVSLKPDIKKILNSILRQVSEIEYPKAEAWMLTELIDKIREILEKKRYIIVIDDIWCKTEWAHIKNVLVENNLGNKVIVITRNADMAEFCCSSVDGTMYELKTLSDADSKRLFCKRIFNKYDGINSELEEVTQKFLKKCGGVPLAIITISSLLASRPRKSKLEWYDVYNSIGSGLEKNENMENMRGILSLSYHDLPSYLKPCLLYLSMFHEDYEIDRDRLVRLWVAEGFVEDHGRNLYELGECYFNELVNRSMIQPVGKDQYGNVRACHIHDMILDLIISLSAEENFATRSDSPNLSSSQSRIRRLSLQDSEKYVYRDREVDQVKLLETMDTSHVRSLIGFGDSSKWTPPLSNFSVLRVLDIEGFPSDKNHFKNIQRLHHLRYLAPKPKNAVELPEEIGNLQHLKTLDLRAAHIRELPTSVLQLKQLECLLLPFFVRMPDGIGNLRSLQELSWLNVTKSPNSLAELGKLAEMRILSILGLNSSKGKTFLHSLSNLGQIRSLTFKGSGLFSIDCLPDPWTAPARLRNFDGGSITFCQLPWWFFSLSELSRLSIWVQKLRDDDFEMLGALPELRYLDIQLTSDAPTVKERWEVGNIKPFHSLVEFHFTHSTRFWLMFAPGAMPKLQSLGLRFAVAGWNRKSDGFHVGLENLISLKNFSTQVVCTGAQVEEVVDVENEIRDAIAIHPNHPILELTRWGAPILKEDEEDYDHEI